jgi:hypothetical protein
LARFGPFRYCTKVDAKLADLVPLSHKFAKQRRVGIFRNERTRSTPFDPKLMFWGISDRFVTATHVLEAFWTVSFLHESRCKTGRTGAINAYLRETKLRQIFRNEHSRSTPLDPKVMFWGVLDRFVTA